MNKLSFNFTISCFFALLLSAFLAGYFSVHQLAIPAEAAMRLSCGLQIADGARPYIDFLDNSSPFALYLASLPGLVSKIVFIHPVLIFNLMVLLLTLVSLLLVLSCGRGRHRRLILLQFCLPAIAFAVALSQLYFLSHFGQEGGLFFLLFLPYLTQRYLSLTFRNSNKPGGPLLIGFLAALGLLLNPVFLLALVAVEFTCLFSLGEISLLKLKRRYFTTELKACLLSLLVLCLLLFSLVPSVVLEYLGPISRINQLTFEYFNEDLAYVGKSPDRRDLVYAFVMFFVLALPVAARCLLTRLMCLMSAFGFACFVFSGTLFSHQGILMIAYSLTALALSVNRYIRSFRFAKVWSARLVDWCSARLNRRVLLLLTALVVICFIASSFVALRLIKGNTFSLSELGYYGFGLERDLSFFSKAVRAESAARDCVWIYSEQISPAFPLLTQLRRKPGYLVWGFPLHTLKILHERGTPDQIAQLADFEASMYDRLRVEALSPRPPTLILVEDGEVRDLFKANGLIAIIEQFYSPLDSCSPLNGDEIDNHEPYEYLGYRVCFSVDKLRK
jgi:hypothetical protein